MWLPSDQAAVDSSASALGAIVALVTPSTEIVTSPTGGMSLARWSPVSRTVASTWIVSPFCAVAPVASCGPEMVTVVEVGRGPTTIVCFVLSDGRKVKSPL